ncbi:hypothetical protein QFC19_001624 [Naganishia cerealis]|uniref:Uncharacterized protein n=1 Tax=Naganishia cerealis TaxID=610337 RepID=A0ACC2WFH7_9TREE|nr:hypothetical protein QFC19_001624 [Naganishia cerealis]
MRGTQPSRNYVSELPWLLCIHRLFKCEPQQQVPTIVEPRRGDTVSHGTRTTPNPSNTNLLDFTEPTRQSPTVLSPSSLMPTPIQPQRRGRPTRTSMNSGETGFPPGATGGSATSDAFRIPKTDNREAAPSSPFSGASSLQSKSPQPQLVSDIKKFTAEFSDAFSPKVSDETFQAGTSQPAGSSSNSFGFENSFDPSSSFFGSAQKLSPLRTSKSLQPGMGNAADSSAFESSISPPSPMPHATLAGSKTANPQSTAESSFEERYPSLERIHSDDSADLQLHTSPLLSPTLAPDQVPVSSSKPARGKSMQRSMPSYHQASLTGGTYGEGHTHASDIQGGIPLPRSNHVTGTAFKMMGDTPEHPAPSSKEELSVQTGPPLSTSSDERLLPDYVDIPSPPTEPTRAPSIPPMQESLPSPVQGDVSATVPSPARPSDLLTGDDDSSLPFLSMRPNQQPLKLSKGSKAPPPLVAKPPSLSLNSTTMNSGTAHSRPGLPRAPSGIYNAQWSPVETAKANLVKSPLVLSKLTSTDAQASTSRMPTVTSPLDFSTVRDTATSTDSTLQEIPRQDHRPSPTLQPSGNTKSSTYPMPNRHFSEVPASSSDSLGRRSSLDAVISDFSAMAPSSDGAGPVHLSAKSSAHSKKPPVANKPAQLKAVERTGSFTSNDGLARSRSMYTTGGASGRTFGNKSPLEAESNITKRTAYAASSAEPETSMSTDESVDTGKRSVNALIAQWSRAGPPVQGTPVSALRAKPPIGTGRKL